MWLVMHEYREIQRPHRDPREFVVDDRFVVEVTRLSQRIVIDGARASSLSIDIGESGTMMGSNLVKCPGNYEFRIETTTVC